MVVRYLAGTRTGFSILAVAAIFVASLALAQEKANESPSLQELPPESSAFYARVATFFGMDPKLIRGLVPELRQEKVNTGDAVLLILFAHKQAALSIFDQLRDARNKSRDSRDLHRHRFHERHGDPIHVAVAGCDARQDKNVCALEILPNLFLRHRSFQFDDLL